MERGRFFGTNEPSHSPVTIEPSSISNPSRYPRVVTYLLFMLGLVYTLITWLMGVVITLLLCWGSRIFLSDEKHLELGYKVGSNFFKVFFGGLIWARILKIEDHELLPYCDPHEPLIIASNHPALWDAPLLLRRFPRISGIMKAEILNNPILKTGSRFIGFLPNHPSLTMVRSAQTRLNQQAQLLLFPEGTRTRERHAPLNPFQPGLGFLAKQTQIPVLPVFIFVDCDYLQKGWPLWKIPPLPITVSIQTGDLQQPEAEEKSKAFSKRLEGYFKTELERRNPWKKTCG